MKFFMTQRQIDKMIGDRILKEREEYEIHKRFEEIEKRFWKTDEQISKIDWRVATLENPNSDEPVIKAHGMVDHRG